MSIPGRIENEVPGDELDALQLDDDRLLALRRVGRDQYTLQLYDNKADHKLAAPVWRPGNRIALDRADLSRVAAMLKRFERGEAPPSDETVRLAPDQLEELAQRVHELGRT